MSEAPVSDSDTIDLTEEVTPPDAAKSQPGTAKSQNSKTGMLPSKPATSNLDILAALSSRASEELNVAQTLTSFTELNVAETLASIPERNVAQALISMPKARPLPGDLNINTELATTSSAPTATPSSSNDGALTSTTNSTLPSSISSSSATSWRYRSPLEILAPTDPSTVALLANSFPDCPMMYLGMDFAQDFPAAFPVVYFPNLMYLNLRALGLEDFQEHPDLSSLPLNRLDFKMKRLKHELLAIRAAAAITRSRLMYVQQIDKLNTLRGATLHHHSSQIDLTKERLHELRQHLLANRAMFKRDIMKLEATETELAIAVVQRTEELDKTAEAKQKRLNNVPRFSGATWKHIGLTDPKAKNNAGEGPAPK